MKISNVLAILSLVAPAAAAVDRKRVQKVYKAKRALQPGMEMQPGQEAAVPAVESMSMSMSVSMSMSAPVAEVEDGPGGPDNAPPEATTTVAAPTTVGIVPIEEETASSMSMSMSMVAEEEPGKEGPEDSGDSIYDLGVANPDFSTLVSLVDAAGLSETLSGDGPFTLFGEYSINNLFNLCFRLEHLSKIQRPHTVTILSLTFYYVPNRGNHSSSLSLKNSPH